MIVSLKSWLEFIKKLGALDDKAAKLITGYMSENDISGDDARKAFLDYAYAVATKYGEASSSLACDIYDMIAEAQNAHVPPAVPAPAPTYSEVARTVNGASMFSQNPDYIGGAVGNLVKRTGVDTTLNNALRDGAEWAWIPQGDTCPFCLMLASNGWQRASKKALRKGHANHIHANCDCTYAIRFDGVSTIEGYDPDALYEQYKNAEGRTGTDKVNYLRRQKYAANKDLINAQKRWAYAKKNGFNNRRRYGKIIIDGDEFVPCLREVSTGNIVDTVVEEADRKSLSGYNEKTGWYINWSKVPKDASIYKLMVRGSDEAQGLIAITPVNDHGAMYINWAVTAPHNNPLLLKGAPKRYEGVGGHLMAIVAEKSIEHGYGGAAFGFAANKDLLQYYIERFGAMHLPIEHPYEVFYDEHAMLKLLEEYNYEWK